MLGSEAPEEFGATEQDPNLGACDEVVSDPDQANGTSEILSLIRSIRCLPMATETPSPTFLLDIQVLTEAYCPLLQATFQRLKEDSLFPSKKTLLFLFFFYITASG